MSRLADQLAERIKHELDTDVVPQIERTRAGKWQRMAGAVSWFMRDKNDHGVVCSAYPAKECLKAPKWSLIQSGMDTEILIENSYGEQS